MHCIVLHGEKRRASSLSLCNLRPFVLFLIRMKYMKYTHCHCYFGKVPSKTPYKYPGLIITGKVMIRRDGNQQFLLKLSLSNLRVRYSTNNAYNFFKSLCRLNLLSYYLIFYCQNVKSYNEGMLIAT